MPRNKKSRYINKSRKNTQNQSTSVKHSVKIVINQPARQNKKKKFDSPQKSNNSSSVSKLYPTVQYVYLNRAEMPAAPVANSIAQAQIEAHKNAGNVYIPWKSVENLLGTNLLKQEPVVDEVKENNKPLENDNTLETTSSLQETLVKLRDEYKELGGDIKGYNKQGTKLELKSKIKQLQESIAQLTK